MRKSEPSRSEQRLARFTNAVRDAGFKLTHQRLETWSMKGADTDQLAPRMDAIRRTE
jgi:hypothetical protein